MHAHISTGAFIPVLSLAHYVVEHDVVHLGQILCGEEGELRGALALVEWAIDFGYRHGRHHGSRRVPRHADRPHVARVLGTEAELVLDATAATHGRLATFFLVVGEVGFLVVFGALMPGIFKRRARIRRPSSRRRQRRGWRHVDTCGFTKTVVIFWQVGQLEHLVHDRASLPITHALRLKHLVGPIFRIIGAIAAL